MFISTKRFYSDEFERRQQQRRFIIHANTKCQASKKSKYQQSALILNFEATLLFFFQNKEQGGNEFQQKPPSFVVHARNLVENVGEENIYDALEQYGDIIEIVLMPKKRQALIEFEDIDSAINCVNDASQSGIYICGAAAYFNYSSHQKQTKREFPAKLLVVLINLFFFTIYFII